LYAEGILLFMPQKVTGIYYADLLRKLHVSIRKAPMTVEPVTPTLACPGDQCRRMSLAAMHLVCVSARPRRSGFNSRLRRLVGACRSTKHIFRD